MKRMYQSLLAKCLLPLFTLMLLAGCAGGTGTASTTLPDGMQRYNSRFLGVFDTVTSFIGVAESEEAFTAYSDRLQEELTRLHQNFDTFKSYEGMNNLKTVNDNAGVQAIEVDPVVIRLMDQALEANERANGRVNMAFGAVLEIWHDHRDYGISHPDEATLPELSELEDANLHTDITQVVIDREANTIYLPDPKMRLDVGSGAKGLAVELVSEMLVEEGMTNFLLNVGGNVKAVGHRDARSEKWRVGIQDPDGGEEEYIEIVHVSDMAVVTSGIYERYYTVDGKRYHHIIHPDTLFPAYNFDSVTIIVPSSGLADSLTTALFNMPIEEGKEMIESIDGAAALWVKDGELIYSDRMTALLKP